MAYSSVWESESAMWTAPSLAANSAAFPWNAPEIAGVNKDDLGAADGWFLQQQVRVNVDGGEARGRKGGK